MINKKYLTILKIILIPIMIGTVFYYPKLAAIISLFLLGITVAELVV